MCIRDRVYADDNYVYLTLKMIADIGTPIDWSWIARVGTYVAGAGLIVAGVFTANPLLVAYGAGMLTSAAVITVSEMASYENVQRIRQEAEETIRTFNTRAQAWRGDLESYLDQLVQQGKITEDEKNTILSYFDQVVQEANNAMKQLSQLIDKAYDTGYKDGVASQKAWITVAAVGGFVAGYILGSR